jgi:hypothetical protein
VGVAELRFVVEFDEASRRPTLLEYRPPWSDLIDFEWTRVPIARIASSKHAAEGTSYRADLVPSGPE